MTSAALANQYFGPRFDARWYASRYRGRLGPMGAREHYLAVGRRGGCKPNSAILDCVSPRDPLAFAEADLRNEVAVIEDAGIFDHPWYAARYGIPLDMSLQHYLVEGAYEGLDPSPFFSTEGYYLANGEVAAAGTNALWHYILFGYEEGRAGSLTPRLARISEFDEDVWRYGFVSAL